MPAGTLCCLLLPLVFFFLTHGYSLGDDLPFHLGSWADASQQLRHGVYPQWDTAAAYGAGEPRFIFYPPLSWLLGAVLRMFAGPAHATEWFVCVAVALCWLGMYLAARQWSAVPGALIAATVYAAAPYTLFNGFERAAFGELLASALLPLLFAACIAPVPTVAALSVPLALIWLTNVPTAILASYLLLTVAVFRLVLGLRQRARAHAVTRQAAVFAGGAALGLLLTSFFLLPALSQEKEVQIATAFSQGQSFRDNFLLRHTALTSRQTIHSITLIVLAYTCALLCVVAVHLSLRWRRKPAARAAFGAAPEQLPALLAVLAAVLLFLLLPLSAPVWQYLPELAVLQFPWRVLSLVTLVLAYAVALSLHRFRIRTWHAVAASALLAVALIPAEARLYWRDPQQVEEHGVTRAVVAAKTQLRPTQEYTPIRASNAGLQPMPTAQCEDADPVAAAGPAAPRMQWQFRLKQPALCTMPLRGYSRWTVLIDGTSVPMLSNHEGRIVLHLPAGTSLVTASWRSRKDRFIGFAVTLVAMLLLIAPRLKPRSAEVEA